MSKKSYDSTFCSSLPLHKINLIQPHAVLPVVGYDDLSIQQVSENVEKILQKKAPDLIETFLTDYVSPGQLTDAMAAMEQAGDVPAICTIADTEIKRVSGFGKVMVYRFDDDRNGTVIAAIMEEGMDHEVQPVGLYPVINPLTQNFIDLSDCDKRAVAAVHLEYMKSMNIMASMSIRLVKDEPIHYHPGNSFAVWQQTVKHTSLAWKSYMLEMAEVFRDFVLEFMVKKHVF